MADLLLELLSEEIPARMQPRAVEALCARVGDGLKAAGLGWQAMEGFVTPRRLALHATGVPATRPDVSDERRGPRVGAPDKAVEGFLKANGLASLDQCVARKTDKNEFWFAVIERKGGPTAEVLPGIVAEVVTGFPWPKSMRWGSGSLRWVRPLRGCLCLFEGKPVGIELPDGVACGTTTVGHRFHAPHPFEVSGFVDYRDKLRAASVILDGAERRELIVARARALAAAEGLALRDDPALAGEVAGLVEWPVPMMGRIDEAFMAVPPEVLTTAMRAHQRYFATERADGSLASRFIVVANIETDDGGKAVIAGNERVLRARLADAKFFWDQDRRRKLESRVPRLDEIVFHARLGTLAQKVERLQALAAEIAASVPGANLDKVRSAATLAKADLTTGMVGEFPELQGIMGRYYALDEGEAPEVADAIADHYRPAGPDDRCPTAPVTVAVALADKLDTLAGFFAIGEKPTGSRDPYALRRAALGVIRLVLENGIRVELRALFRAAAALYDGIVALDPKTTEVVVEELLDFFAERLKVHLRAEGVRHDLINAVFALGDEDDLVRLLARVRALQGFVGSEDGANLLVAHKRAAGIVAIEEKRDNARYDGAPEATQLVEDAERALYDGLDRLHREVAPVIAAEKFDEAMTLLASLRRPVDRFFDDVTVNSEDARLRANRLRLLSQIRATMDAIADFSRIEG